MYIQRDGITTTISQFSQGDQWKIISTSIEDITLVHSSGDEYTADRDIKTGYRETVQKMFETEGMARFVAEDLGCDPNNVGEFINNIVNQAFS